MISEADLDLLYQVPLGEFVSARNALAARAGDRRAEIRGLEKPNAAAWGVNRLYWRRRKVLDRLVSGFEHVRRAQTRLLAGDTADLAKAETAHRAALGRALREVRRLLEEAGDTASASTMAAVAETLQALPFSAFSGKLSRPLAPVGFGALAGLLGGIPPDRPTADVVSISRGRRRSDSSARDAEIGKTQQKKAEAQRRADLAQAEARLAGAQKEARAAHRLATKAESDADKARAARDQLRERLEAADDELHRKHGEATRARTAVREAEVAIAQLAGELERLKQQ